jgi:hypothetical protein
MHSTLRYERQFENPQNPAGNSLHARARQRGQWGQFRAGLTGHSRELLALRDVRAACLVEAESDVGALTVCIDQIRGSESRVADFDRDFNPLQDRTRARWIGIAQARWQGKALPPVALVRVGDLYFVRDGHHRISVARALGQKRIEARVIVWQVAGPLPWEVPAQVAAPGNERLIVKVRRKGTRFRECVQVGLDEFLGAAATLVGCRPLLSQPRVDKV